jgi:hypothetical protein
MAAPKGNKFWKLRSKHGRDKLFATPELLWEAACEYFEWCEQNPFFEDQVQKIKGIIGYDGEKQIYGEKIIHEPIKKMRPFTIHALCLYLGCNSDYFTDFEDNNRKKSDDLSLDFSRVIKRIRDTIYSQKFSGAASGFFNANIIARDLGLHDSHEITGKDGHPLIPKNELTDEERKARIELLKAKLNDK